MAISSSLTLANFTKGGFMKKVFTIIGVVFSILLVGYLALNWWTETKHDKPAYQWIQELNDKKDSTTDDLIQDETNEEIESQED